MNSAAPGHVLIHSLIPRMVKLDFFLRARVTQTGNGAGVTARQFF